MFMQVLLWGALAGVIHFVVLGALYGNPFVDRMYVQACDKFPSVKRWESKPRYLLAQLLGTQVEVYLLTIGFFWLRPCVGTPGLSGSLLLGILFTAIRIYPRFWNMWIQSTYPRQLLGTEALNGTIGTFAIIVTLHFAYGA
jgi:hypothetical protein